MGVRVGLDIEDIEDPCDCMMPEGKGLLCIVNDCIGGQDNFLNELSKNYSFDLSPLGKLPEGEDEEGPWQDAAKVRKSAIYMLHAFKKEGKALKGKVICGNGLNDEDIEFYMYELRCVIQMCRVAIENKKRVRLVIW